MTRLEKLAERLPEGVDAGLVTSGIARRYYTGFPSSAGVLLVTRKKSRFLIDFRYYEHAKQKITDCEVYLLENLSDQLNRFLTENGVKTVGMETDAVTLEEYHRYREMLPDVEILDDGRFQRLISEDRLLKTEQEIKLVSDAQRIAEAAFEETLNFITAGKTEREIALYLDYRMRKLGAEDISFDTIVASGCHSAVPHAVPTDKPIESGDFIVIDFGATLAGYHSDMTRTVSVGTVSEEQERVYDTVLRAQLAALEQVKAGVPCAKIDAAARDLIHLSGYEGCFGHSTGHGIGLEIHEQPNVSPKSQTITQTGMLFSVEPGIYLAGKFGVRIEDMVVVREKDYLNLTKTKKERISL